MGLTMTMPSLPPSFRSLSETTELTIIGVESVHQIPAWPLFLIQQSSRYNVYPAPSCLMLCTLLSVKVHQIRLTLPLLACEREGEVLI